MVISITTAFQRNPIAFDIKKDHDVLHDFTGLKRLAFFGWSWILRSMQKNRESFHFWWIAPLGHYSNNWFQCKIWIESKILRKLYWIDFFLKNEHRSVNCSWNLLNLYECLTWLAGIYFKTHVTVLFTFRWNTFSVSSSSLNTKYTSYAQLWLLPRYASFVLKIFKSKKICIINST